MELKEGMYVRTKEGYIAKIKEIKANERLHLYLKAIYTDNYHIDMVLEDEIIKASNNIIDLIEVGDYVNGLIVNDIVTDIDGTKTFNLFKQSSYFGNEDIKSIVTREMYSSVEYRVETD